MKFQVSYAYSDCMKLQISLAFHILHDIWCILMIMRCRHTIWSQLTHMEFPLCNLAM